jgi:hypothetical protein
MKESITNSCDSIDKHLKILKKDSIIYTTKRGNYFYFVEHKNSRLYFSIPNHNDPQKPYIKSIKVEHFCDLISKLKGRKLTEKTFHFKIAGNLHSMDLRRSYRVNKHYKSA